MQSLQKVFGRHKDKPKQGGKKSKETKDAAAAATAEEDDADDDWELLDEDGECTALNADDTMPYAGLFTQKGRVTRQDFEALRTLGVGAQATVLLVRHKRDGKLYALKILKKKDVVASGRPRDPVRERNIMKGAPQSFLVNMHYCFQSVTKLFFVLDYMPGGDLYYYTGEWEGGHFSELTARYYAAQVYLALQSLHDAGVIYRDLKPENVLLDENGNAKLADFGLSTQVDQKERAQSFVGTAFYIAPEILQNKAYGTAVDWWSFGVLVFNLLTGENPFYGEKLEQIFESILTKGYHVRSCYAISDAAKDLLSKLLVKDEKKRISDTAIRKHPWFNGLDWKAIERREGAAPDWRPPEDMITAEAAAGMIGKTMQEDSFSVKCDISKEHQKLFENFTMDNTGAPPQMKNGGTAFDR
eukprot:Hpha_TRINITY_DN470_c0_g1::TRINITY_DN470_c0_g1_i1::g.27556::m.27556